MIINFEIPDDDVAAIMASQFIALYRPRSLGDKGITIEGSDLDIITTAVSNVLRKAALEKAISDAAKALIQAKPQYPAVEDFKSTHADNVQVIDLGGAKE